MLNYVLVAYVNLIATGIVFNIRASSSHIGRMMPFSEHRRWIISVFDRRSIMNRLYWHDQQVGYVCFVPSVWEQRGVIAAVADQTAMISHLLPMCWATRGGSWGHVMMWARFGSQGSIALNWHSRYSGTRYSGTWLYIGPCLPCRLIIEEWLKMEMYFLNRALRDPVAHLHLIFISVALYL